MEHYTGGGKRGRRARKEERSEREERERGGKHDIVSYSSAMTVLCISFHM
jgi:hypothetical protein